MTVIPEEIRGDGPCQDCGGENIIWFTESGLWNAVMGGLEATDDPGGILCVPCFAVRAHQVSPGHQRWKLVAEL